MTTIKTPPPASDDIDLFALIERSILFLRRYRWVFIISILAGLAAGIFFYTSIAKTYKSKMLLHSFTLTNQEEINIIRHWNELLSKNEYEILASELETPVQVLHKVKKVSAREVQQVFSPTNPNGFIVEVIVTDNDVLPAMQKGLIHGFENSEYMRERLAVKRASLKELIDKTTREIQKLDSTKSKMESIIDGRGAASSSLIIDGSSINRQLVEMNEKLLSFKEALQFTSAVQVLHGFQPFRKPDNPKLLPWLIIGLLASLSFAYVFSLVHSINRTLKWRSRQRELMEKGAV